MKTEEKAAPRPKKREQAGQHKQRQQPETDMATKLAALASKFK